ncbi:MAG: VOC family protein [Candidatus Poribacteria bacterium]|nr:VOC family protein [Candidatus Poribacteria bacterium]
MGNPVTHFEIAGRNAEKLSEFYGDLFDWKITKDPSGIYSIVPNGGIGIEGNILPVTEEMCITNYVSVYITVDNLEKALEKVETNGGNTILPPQPIPGNAGSIAMFADPRGNVIGLYKQNQRELKNLFQEVSVNG